jgi:hypothetical protein
MCFHLYLEAKVEFKEVESRVVVNRAWERCGEGGRKGKRTVSGYRGTIGKEE